MLWQRRALWITTVEKCRSSTASRPPPWTSPSICSILRCGHTESKWKEEKEEAGKLGSPEIGKLKGWSVGLQEKYFGRDEVGGWLGEVTQAIDSPLALSPKTSPSLSTNATVRWHQVRVEGEASLEAQKLTFQATNDAVWQRQAWWTIGGDVGHRPPPSLAFLKTSLSMSTPPPLWGKSKCELKKEEAGVRATGKTLWQRQLLWTIWGDVGYR